MGVCIFFIFLFSHSTNRAQSPGAIWTFATLWVLIVALKVNDGGCRGQNEGKQEFRLKTKEKELGGRAEDEELQKTSWGWYPVTVSQCATAWFGDGLWGWRSRQCQHLLEELDGNFLFLSDFSNCIPWPLCAVRLIEYRPFLLPKHLFKVLCLFPVKGLQIFSTRKKKFNCKLIWIQKTSPLTLF